MSRVDDINSFKKTICPDNSRNEQKRKHSDMIATIIRLFAHKSTNAKQRPHSLYVQKKRFYSPFMLTKFEWTMFRIAKKQRRKKRGELILPSKRVAPVRSCSVDQFDHVFALSTKRQCDFLFFAKLL